MVYNMGVLRVVCNRHVCKYNVGYKCQNTRYDNIRECSYSSMVVKYYETPEKKELFDDELFEIKD